MPVTAITLILSSATLIALKCPMSHTKRFSHLQSKLHIYTHTDILAGSTREVPMHIDCSSIYMYILFIYDQRLRECVDLPVKTRWDLHFQATVQGSGPNHLYAQPLETGPLSNLVMRCPICRRRPRSSLRSPATSGVESLALILPLLQSLNGFAVKIYQETERS